MDSQYDRVDPPQGDLLEPIAVIGFSFKFPQGATSSAALWKMFEEKRCAMTEWPSDRINLDAFYHVDQNRCDTVFSRFFFFFLAMPTPFYYFFIAYVG